MKTKLSFLAGAAFGFVLGSRAGRESYEKMKTSAKDVWADVWARDAVRETIATVENSIKAQTGEAVHKLAQQVLPAGKSDEGTETRAPKGSLHSSGANPLDIVPEVSDEFPDAALAGGEGQHWRGRRRSGRKRPDTGS